MKSVKQFVFGLRILLTIIIITAITACGGGGGDVGTKNPTSPPIVINPPAPVLVKPDYQGITTVSNILPQDAANLSFDVTSALDFLNLLAFGDTVEYFLIHPSEDDSKNSDEIVCQSGSVTTTEIKVNKEFRVDYNNCVQEGILLNGSLTVHLIKLIDAVLSDTDIVADLTMEDLTLNEQMTISGYVKVRERTGNFETTATYQIMFQNELNEQIYFDDFTASINHHGENRGIDYQGDVYFSQLGKFTLSTVDLFNSQDNGQRMEISGNNSIVVDIYLQDQIVITYSEGTIPQSISLIDPPASIFDDTNEIPSALISANSYTTDRNVEITLSSRDSSDPDYDILAFYWDIISAPQGATWSITQSVDTLFSGDLPGNYTIRLVVDDNQSAAIETTKVITVEKGLPSGNINELTASIVIDGAFSAQIDMDNDQFDKPFEYRLAYGPSGMQVNQEGLITWNAHIPDFGVTTDVNFAVEVLNSDKNNRLSGSTKIASGTNHNITKLRTKDIFDQISWSTQIQTYRDTNNREHFTAFVSATSSTNIPYEYLLDENDNIEASWAVLNLPNNFKYAAKYDVNKDGIADHFLTHFNDAIDIIDRNELWLMNGATKELTLFAAHQYNVWGTFTFKDMNNQAGVELLAYNENAVVDVVVYSIDNSELLYQSNQSHRELVGYCDFNGDGIDEVISESFIIDLVKNERLVVLEHGQQFDTFNLNDESKCSLLVDDYGELSLYKYQNNEFVSFPFSLTNFESTNYHVGNFDGDDEDELLYFYENEKGDNNWVLVNFDNDLNHQEQLLTIPEGMEFMYQSIISVMDLDGDNIDEILYYNHISLSNTWNLSAINLSGTTLSTSFTGENNYKSSQYSSGGRVVNFQNDNVTINYNNSYDAARLVTFSPFTSPAEIEIPIGDVIGSEKSPEGLFYYTHHKTFGANNKNEIMKYDENGTIIWQTEVANDYRNYVIADIDIGFGLLIISVSGSYPHQVIINTENGKVLSESSWSSFGYAFISPSISDKTKVITGYSKEALSYSNGELNRLFAGLDESFGIDLSRVDAYTSFIQYDEDPQLEILIYYTGPSKTQSHQQNYLIIDSLTWTKEVLKRGDQGFIPYRTLIPQREILSCIALDSSCRNSLKRQDYKIEMIDKLTGKIIWHSPNFPYGISDIRLDIGNDNHIRMAISGFGIYIFE